MHTLYICQAHHILHLLSAQMFDLILYWTLNYDNFVQWLHWSTLLSINNSTGEFKENKTKRYLEYKLSMKNRVRILIIDVQMTQVLSSTPQL